LLAASGGTRLLIALFFHGSEYVPIPNSPDLRVLAFTLTLSCCAAMIFGLMPAMRMSSRAGLGIRAACPGIKGSRIGGSRIRGATALIAGEVALSLVVLAMAGGFARSLANLGTQQFGFEQDHVLVVNIDMSHAGYDDNRLLALYRVMYSRLNSLPGIRSAAFSHYSPFNECCWAFSIGLLGYSPKPDESMSVRLNRVSPGYFRTIGTKVLRGRTFDEHDGPASRRVAVVNEEFVRRFLAHKNPLGRRFGIGGPADAGDLEIVGVVADAKYESPREDPTPMAFLPFLQEKAGESSAADGSNLAGVIEARSAGAPTAVASEIRRALAEIDPGLPVVRVSTLANHVSFMLNQENVIAALALFFGFVALLLSCLGLYGLMAYSVQRRTSEIGIRMALGARPGGVVGMVLREAVVQGFTGVLIGVPASFAALRLVASQFYGVSANDPTYSVTAALGLLLCISAAAYVPALRASRVDPLIALRYE
jgi:predicted permease